jgi:hypothetical protein
VFVCLGVLVWWWCGVRGLFFIFYGLLGGVCGLISFCLCVLFCVLVCCL